MLRKLEKKILKKEDEKREQEKLEEEKNLQGYLFLLSQYQQTYSFFRKRVLSALFTIYPVVQTEASLKNKVKFTLLKLLDLVNKGRVRYCFLFF